MNIWEWALWAIILIAQNFAFTFVSRARNSGSIGLHAVAALFSNGIWFAQFGFAISAFMSILTGKYGWKMAIFSGLYYTAFTVSGSLLAHYYALKTEKGHKAVGANKKYAQIPVEDWEKLKRLIE